jgi:hypothetical protein
MGCDHGCEIRAEKSHSATVQSISVKHGQDREESAVAAQSARGGDAHDQGWKWGTCVGRSLTSKLPTHNTDKQVHAIVCDTMITRAGWISGPCPWQSAVKKNTRRA